MTLDKAKDLLAKASKVAVLTGAGVSTDSGIPDYRGPHGLWTKNPDLERLSDIHYFMNDPEVRKASWIRRVVGFHVADIKPNLNHKLLADYQNNSGKVSRLVTQNVDGLHLAAGSDPKTTIEIHGNITRANCTQCGLEVPFPSDLTEENYQDPVCPACLSLVKPSIVMFGESLNENDVNVAFAAAHACNVMLCVGTSLSVYPIAGMAGIAAKAGASVVTVCNEPTDMDYLATAVTGEIRDVLPELLEEV